MRAWRRARSLLNRSFASGNTAPAAVSVHWPTAKRKESFISVQVFIQMTKSLLSISLAILAAGVVSAGSLHAQDAPAAPAVAVAAAAPTPTLEQRVAGLEAYLTNSDPSVPLKIAKDAKGAPAVPDGLTSPSVGTSGPGHNAWMMASAALVLFMTLPGLALFYGGLVRKKNVLSVCAQCLGCAGLVTILWYAVGYSLVFGKSFGSGFLGGSEYYFLKGVNSAPNTDYSYWVSQNVFSMYQLMFAIITPALIVGAIAERMKYTTLMMFIGLWMVVVYFPLAHMVWGVTGFMNGTFNPDAKIHALDFAGGTVVHMSSGWSALVLCIILGKRLGFGKTPMAPHSMVLCMVGTGMLWVGWYGFNAGSAVAADGVAANAFMTTTIATAVALFRVADAGIFPARQTEHPGLLLGRGGRSGRGDPGVWLHQRDGCHHHRDLRGGGAVLFRGESEGMDRL